MSLVRSDHTSLFADDMFIEFVVTPRAVSVSLEIVINNEPKFTVHFWGDNTELDPADATDSLMVALRDATRREL